jgi:glucose 1-dehydrogenase
LNPNLVSLEGKVAIVTGAGVGMGAATARLLAARGAKVIVSDINPATAAATVEAIRSAGGTAHAVTTDVADEAAVAALVAETVATFGRLDCAVNNAAITPDVLPIAEADMAVFDKVLAVDLRSVMLCMKYEIRQFLAQGSPGSIVNIGSVSSFRPQPNNAAYVAAKHGVIGLTKTGSLEYAGKGIRVNAVLPGAIDTPMLRGALEETGFTEADFAPALSLFGRFGKPEEVAEASAWLCSDASSYVTGHSLAVEGGYLTR